MDGMTNMSEELNTIAENEALPPHRRKQASAAEKKQQKFLVFLIILVAAAAGLILYRNGVMGGGSARTPVEKYLNAIADCDFDSYVGAMPPKMAAGYESDLKDSGLGKEAFMRELYSDYFGEFGDDMSVTIEFNQKSRLEAQYFDSFKKDYRELYKEELKTSAAFELDVSALFSGSKSKALIQLECFVIKLGGKWYIVGCDYKTQDASETE